MFGNHLKTAWRNLSKNKFYGFINIGGLAIGLTCFILLLLFFNHELSYDTWDAALRRVYKVSARTDVDVLQQTPAPLARFLKEKLPRVEAATSIQPAGSIEILLDANAKKIYQTGGVNSDSLFFRVFPYRFVYGTQDAALNKPNAIVLSEALSEKLFGATDPMGKTVKVFNAFDCEVSGVFEVPDKPSHLDVQFVWRSPYEQQNMFWENQSYQTYVRTVAEVPVASLETDADKAYYLERLAKDQLSYDSFRQKGHSAGLFVEAVHRLHNFPKHGNSAFPTLRLLLLLAALLLISGAINFSNLSIAAAVSRAREIGVRKVLGSSGGHIRRLFLYETVFQCFLSLAFAVVLVQLALPYFNQSFSLSLKLFTIDNLSSIGWQLLLCVLIVSLIAGLYPAVHLSRFVPVKVLKGDLARNAGGTGFRNALIVVQFAVSAFFVTGTLAVSRQMQYMQDRDRGFKGAQVMRINATQKTRDTDFETVRSKLLSIPGVEVVAKATTIPGDPVVDTSVTDFQYADKVVRMASVKVSTDYFSALNIRLLRGRLLDNRTSDQHTRSAVINETAGKMLGAESIIGKTIHFPFCDTVPVTVVGIVKDIHVTGFENNVQPVVYSIGNNACMFQSGGGLIVKLNSSSTQKSVAGIAAAWKEIEPDFPIRYSFLDDNFNQLLVSHHRLQKVIWLFTAVAIFIAVMGLIALSAFYMGRRTKEIGVRKVLGADLPQLATMLSKDFIRLVLIAVLIAFPLTWWSVQRWLQTFAYRTTVPWWLFALSGSVLLMITIIAIGYQVLRAATANPVKSLRTE